MQLIVAEKPSVARDIARVLGATTRGDGALRSDRYVVTWCVGHLVELEEPDAYDPAYKRWSLAALPIVPAHFKLRPVASSLDQWKHVRTHLRDKRFTDVINACDAGREGELIFRLAYELSGSRLPSKRLWISSLTDSALKAGFAVLKPSSAYDPLADAARCRSEADWLVGMNATRAMTTRSRGASNTLYSIGRVQTPTLALIVAREEAIVRFVPKDYWEVSGAFRTDPSAKPFGARFGYDGTTRFAREPDAQTLIARVSAHTAPPTAPRVESIEARTQKIAPPLLFDLTSLQRTANKRYGFSAQRTLDLAQALYETHKLCTYPRTDSRHLTDDIRGELPSIFDALATLPEYAPFATHLRAHPPGPTPRVFANAKVSDHHAIIPTTRKPDGAKLDRDERRLYDLIVRRFLGAFYPDAEFAITVATIVVGADGPKPAAKKAAPTPEGEEREPVYFTEVPPPPDRFIARGRVRTKVGWQEVAGIDDDREKDGDEELQDLPPLSKNQRLTGAYESQAKKTQPPKRYTEASLLAAMESAGKDIEDDVLRLAMKDSGLGTPATRAATIETLLKRTYIERKGKAVVPTARGSGLIHGLPVQALTSAELTGGWEARLARMARREDSREAFMRDIVGFVRTMVETFRSAPVVAEAVVLPTGEGPAVDAADRVGPCPRCAGAVVERPKFFACVRCDFKLWKTIAGKKVSAPLAAVLLNRRRTKVLAGFRSKAGKAFSAALVLQDDGSVKFEFGDGPSAPAAKPAPPTPPTPPAPTPASPAPTPEAKPAPPPTPKRAKAAAAVVPAEPQVALTCPSCGEGTIITGKRAWGCSRWREGCGFVVPFEFAGRKLTDAQLRDLVTRGKTRKATFTVHGTSATGRLTLDASGVPPKVVLDIEE